MKNFYAKSFTIILIIFCLSSHVSGVESTQKKRNMCSTHVNKAILDAKTLTVDTNTTEEVWTKYLADDVRGMVSKHTTQTKISIQSCLQNIENIIKALNDEESSLEHSNPNYLEFRSYQTFKNTHHKTAHPNYTASDIGAIYLEVSSVFDCYKTNQTFKNNHTNSKYPPYTISKLGDKLSELSNEENNKPDNKDLIKKLKKGVANIVNCILKQQYILSFKKTIEKLSENDNENLIALVYRLDNPRSFLELAIDLTNRSKGEMDAASKEWRENHSKKSENNSDSLPDDLLEKIHRYCSKAVALISIFNITSPKTDFLY